MVSFLGLCYADAELANDINTRYQVSMHAVQMCDLVKGDRCETLNA
jgi:hypothetical protein